MTTETEYLSKSYDDDTSTMTKVPSYGYDAVATFPSQLPCSLTIKNLDRSKDPILFLDTREGEKVVYELSNLTHDREGSFDDTLYQNLMAAGGYAAPSKVLVAADKQSPYAMRKHVASSTYEIIQLQKDGSFGATTKIQTKGMFKNKYYLEQSTTSEDKPEDSSMYIKGSFKSLNASLRQVVDGQKTTLIEVVKGVTSTQAHFSASAVATTSAPFLVAAIYAALDSHKEHFLTFTTDEKLEDLQARVKPSTWDSLFLQAGQTSKKQKEFSQQLESERRREYNENVHNNRGPFRNGMIPAQRSESSSRSRSRSQSRNQSRNASPATFNRTPAPADQDTSEERGRK